MDFWRLIYIDFLDGEWLKYWMDLSWVRMDKHIVVVVVATAAATATPSTTTTTTKQYFLQVWFSTYDV